MAVSTSSNHEAGTRSGARVAAWKEDVQSFFNNDWSRLRTLMMELEEASWNKNSAAEPVEVQEERGGINSEQQLASNNSCIHNTGGTTGSEQRSQAEDRLSQLAEQIERQLRTANASGG